MKMIRTLCFLSALIMLLCCGKKETLYDASGVFETTELIVSARGTGEIKSLQMEEGQEVMAGDTLGYLDITQLELKKNQLQSSRTATQSKKLSTQQQVASLQQQISNLQREQARYRALLKDGAATQKQVDDITYQIAVLQKQLVATNEQVSTANNSLDGQSSGFEAQIEQVDDQIKNSIITSPIDGIVLAKYVEQGEYATLGRALFKVANVRDMKLRAYISADQLTAIRLGQKVVVYSDLGSVDRKAYEGVISWISDKAEFTPKTIQTRDERANLVYAIKVSVQNDGFIKRGMYGDIKF